MKAEVTTSKVERAFLAGFHQGANAAHGISVDDWEEFETLTLPGLVLLCDIPDSLLKMKAWVAHEKKTHPAGVECRESGVTVPAV